MSTLADLASAEAHSYAKSANFKRHAWKKFSKAAHKATEQELRDALFEIVGRLASCYASMEDK